MSNISRKLFLLLVTLLPVGAEAMSLESFLQARRSRDRKIAEGRLSIQHTFWMERQVNHRPVFDGTWEPHTQDLILLSGEGGAWGYRMGADASTCIRDGLEITSFGRVASVRKRVTGEYETIQTPAAGRHLLAIGIADLRRSKLVQRDGKTVVEGVDENGRLNRVVFARETDDFPQTWTIEDPRHRFRFLYPKTYVYRMKPGHRFPMAWGIMKPKTWGNPAHEGEVVFQDFVSGPVAREEIEPVWYAPGVAVEDARVDPPARFTYDELKHLSGGKTKLTEKELLEISRTHRGATESPSSRPMPETPADAKRSVPPSSKPEEPMTAGVPLARSSIPKEDQPLRREISKPSAAPETPSGSVFPLLGGAGLCAVAGGWWFVRKRTTL